MLDAGAALEPPRSQLGVDTFDALQRIRSICKECDACPPNIWAKRAQARDQAPSCDLGGSALIPLISWALIPLNR